VGSLTSHNPIGLDGLLRGSFAFLLKNEIMEILDHSLRSSFFHLVMINEDEWQQRRGSDEWLLETGYG
jgi:hypothetical protein